MTAGGDYSVEDRRPTARSRFSLQLPAVPSTSWRLQHDSVPKATVANSPSPVSARIGSEASVTVRAKAEMGLVGEAVQNPWPLGRLFRSGVFWRYR